MKLHLPVKLRASLLAAVVAVPALLYNMAYAGTTYVAPSNEYGWDTNDITLNQRYLQTSGNTYVANVQRYTPYEMYGDTDPNSVNAKVRVGYLPDDTGFSSPLAYRDGKYGTVDPSGHFAAVPDQSAVVFKATGPEQENTASIIVQADAQEGGQYITYMDGKGTFDSQEMVFNNSVKSGVNPQIGGSYQGDVNIDTDAIRVKGSGSKVVLEDVDIQDHTVDGTTMIGEIEHGSQLVILNGNDNLTDAEKQLLNISNVENNGVYNNETPRTVELGAVTGTSSLPGRAGGSLVIVGNKERTEAVTDDDGKITEGAFVKAEGKDDHLDVIISSVDDLSEFGAANADMDIAGDVSRVVTLNLVNSTTEVGGSVGATGINVNGESTLQAVGDIKNINYQGSSSTNISGKVASSEGEISLTNGKITGGAVVSAMDANRGNVTLSNIEATDAGRLEAGHDMTLTEGTEVIGVDDIVIGNDLTVDKGSYITDKDGALVAGGDITVSGDSSITDIRGDVQAGGDITVTDGAISNITGNVEAVEGITVTNGEISNITGNVQAGEGITVTDGAISDITGNVQAGAEGITVTDGEISNITGDVISGGDLSLDGGSLTDVTGTVDVEGDMSVADGSVVENLGGLDVEGGLTVDGSSVTDVANGADAVGELGGDLLVQNDGEVHNVTLAVDGDIIVDNSILGSSKLSATGKLEAKNGAVLRKEEVDEDGSKVWRDNVITVAADSSILSGSQVSGTDLTVKSDAGDPSLEIGGTGTVVTADTNLAVDGTVTVDDSAELSLNGGEQRDASLSANNLVLGTLKDDKASISNGSVNVLTQTSIAAGDTLELADAEGSLGAVVETGASVDDDGTTLDVKDGSVIGAASIGTDAADAGKTGLAEYFDHVNVNGDSTLTVDGSAAAVDYNQGGADTQGSKTTIGGDAWLVDATINGAGTYNVEQGTETTIKGDAHIGNLSIADEGALSIVGADNDNTVNGYVANLNQASDGHINVVNATLTTPELNGANISLGLNGGTVVLDQVAAADGATVASTAATNAHVLVGEITNASAVGAPDQTPHGPSTIQTTLNRLTTEYSFSQGEAATATCKTYVFIAKQAGSVEVNGQTISFDAGDEVRIADTYLNDATDFGTEGSVVEGVTQINMDEFIAQNQDQLAPKLVAVLDGDGNPVLDGQGNPLMAQVTESSTLTYYPDASLVEGSFTTVTDGVASLTVENDFDADKTTINAYRTAITDPDGHITAEDGTGFIDIKGVLSGQDNTLNADADVTINGIVSKEGAEHQAGNTVVSQQGDIKIGEEGIVGSGNVLTSQEGSISVTGATEGNGNKLTANENVTTAAITGDGNVLDAQTGYIETADITGDSNDLDAALDINTGAITGSLNTLDSATASIVTGAIEGATNKLNAELNITTGAITGDTNELQAREGYISVDGKITGDGNKLTASDETNGSITTKDIEGDSNQLLAGTSIQTGAITGNTNDLDAGTTIGTGDIIGSGNTLDAVGDITTGAITGDDAQSLEGNDNILTSTEGSITTDEIAGDSNELTAYLNIETDAISGDENELRAETGYIKTDGSITGDENTLTAEKADITVNGDIEGSWNNLIAGTSITADNIIGSSNELTAGTSIDVGQITGDWNGLTAGTTVSTGSVTGDYNTISGVEGATVDGDVTGTGNAVRSENGTVDITGTLGGSDNVAIAGGVVHIGTVAGQDQTVMSYGKGLAPDDTAIIVDTFRAQGSQVGIATTTGEFGTPSGNGAIVIGSMSAVDGELDDALRNSIVSNVSSIYIGEMDGFNAYTTMKAAKDIVVGNPETLPSPEDPDIAYNQEFVAGGDFLINKENGLTLVNSTITAQGAIKGSSLTLELDDSIRYDVSQAGSVTLDSLTLSGGAQLNVGGKAIIGSLTLEGQFSALDATTTDITSLTLRNGATYNAGLVLVEELTIDNSSMKVDTLADVKELTLDHNAVLNIAGAEGKTDLTEALLVDNGSKLIVAMDLETESSITANSGALIEGRNVTAGTGVTANGGTIEATGGSITAGTGIEAINGTLTARDKIIAKAGSIVASGSSVLTAGKGVEATAGLNLSDASVVNANVTLTGGDATMTGTSKVDGSLTLKGGNVYMTGTATTDTVVTGSVSGAQDATLTNASAGNLDAAGAVTLSNAETGWVKGHSLESSKGSIVKGDATLTGGDAILSATKVEGDILGAGAVTLTGSSIVKNIVNATGNVDLTDSQAMNISSAANVDLTGSSAGTISGANVTLDGGSTSGAITATGTAKVIASTVDGGISGASRVELIGDPELIGEVPVTPSVKGDITMAESNTGVLLDSAVLEGSVIGANGATVQAGSQVTGDLGLISGDAIISASEVNGNITGAENVTLTQGADVGNIVDATGDVSLTGSTADTISATGKVDLENATALDISSTTGDVELTNSHAGTISGANVTLEVGSTSGAITASGTATVTDSTVDGTISGTDVSVTGGSSSGAITASGTATVTGSTVDGTISGADVSVTGGSSSGAITASGTATVTGSTVDGTISGTDVSVTGGSSSGAITASGTATVTDSTVEGNISGEDVNLTNAEAHDITASGEVSLSNADTHSISGATSVEMSAGTVVRGDVTMAEVNDGVTMDASTVIGSINGTNSLEIKNQSTVTGDVTLTGDGDLSIDDSTVHGTVSGAQSITLTNTSTGDVSVSGSVTLDNADTGAVHGNSLTSSNDSTVTGDVTLGGRENSHANLTDTKVTGSITGAANVTLTGSSIGGGIAMNGEALVTGSSIGGTLTGATDATLKGSDVSDVVASGTVTLDDTDAGSITGNALTSSNSSTVTGDVTLGGRDDSHADLTDTTVTGSITGAADASITGGSVTGSVAASGAVLLTGTATGAISGESLASSDSSISGGVTLTGGDATLANTDVDGDLTGAANVTMTEGTVGAISATGSVSLTDVRATGPVDTDASVTLSNAQSGPISGASLDASNGSTVTGDVTLAGGNATVTDSTVTGAITGAADVEIAKGTAASVTATGDVTLTDTTAAVGSVTTDASVTLSNAQSGSLTAESLAADAGSIIDGDVTLSGGDAVVTGESLVTGSITGADGVSVTKSTTGDITGAAGDVNLSNATVGTVGTAGSVLADGTVKSTGSVTSSGLSVAEFGSLTAKDDVMANGLINLDGKLTSTDGSISLTGTGASSIDADVTAKKSLALGGTLAVQQSTLSAQKIDVNGTVNAGEAAVFNGTVTGTGTISKTGGDELVLAADTNMAGGSVNVSDGSTLLAEGGHLGGLTVADGSTLVVGGDAKTATELKADSLTMEAGSRLQSTLNLAAGKADKVTVAGAVDLKGATLVLDNTSTSEEAAIADGTRHTVVGCTVSSGLSEDVEHSMETLNAHVENFGDHIDLVLSKNYKGASKTWNQKQVADSLSSIDPDSVQGTQMGDVLDALGHTRSEADAVAALDSLGGAGLSAMQKVIAEESHEHMQTLRDTLTGLNTGIARRIAEDGSIIPGVNSNAVTASITGGTSNVSGDGNVGDYSRSSLGFMLAGAHAINSKWSFGGGFAYSSSTASCDSVDIDSDAFYFDVALMHNSGRFHQMGTLGAGFYGFDTTRALRVSAPGHDYAGTASGSTSATAINLSYEAAYDLIISKDGHHAFSPVVMAEATFAQIKGMTEGGAGNAGLRSELDDVQSLTVGGGARYTYSFGSEKNPGFVSAEALVLGTAGDDTMKVHNTFIAGGSSFDLNGPKAGGVGLRLNVNALVPIDDQWAIIGNVASEFRSDQSAVSGSLGVKYSF